MFHRLSRFESTLLPKRVSCKQVRYSIFLLGFLVLHDFICLNIFEHHDFYNTINIYCL